MKYSVIPVFVLLIAATSCDSSTKAKDKSSSDEKHNIQKHFTGNTPDGSEKKTVPDKKQIPVVTNTKSAGTKVSITPKHMPIPVNSGIISETAEKTVKSVVNISAEKGSIYQTSRLRGYGRNPRYRRRGSSSLGSGVIVSRDGIILTNNHVVANSQIIFVKLHDGRKFRAKIVGNDPRTDVAVIKLQSPPNDLSPLPIGESASMRLGEVVLAIGNPFGLGGSVTMGIISAKGRANIGIVEYEDFIQTDAAINPGNSGGALINLKGELIGINTAILSKTGGYQGIGFAIPSEMAGKIMKHLVKNGHFTRSYLGVVIKDADEGLSSRGNSSQGALVVEVGPDTPARKAGLLPGDVIISFDGKSVKNSGKLKNMVAMYPVKKPVEMKVSRKGKIFVVKATLSENVDDRKNYWGTPVPSIRNRRQNSQRTPYPSNPWEDDDFIN
ncbi:MAG: trypsin-like peptidase domain-containing protein [Deltaproteobacteria bacterium]|nr:trypsin-like peptidase domain-containing protein [Deltaproteobacteria bacterium]